MKKSNAPSPGEEKMNDTIRQNFLQQARQYLLMRHWNTESQKPQAVAAGLAA